MKTIKSFIATCVVMTLVGCTTLQPLASQREQLVAELKKGDRVEVVTKDGQHLKFTIERVDEHGVSGASQKVVYEDIESISRQQVSAGRTALVVLGAAAAVAAVASGGGGGGSSY